MSNTRYTKDGILRMDGQERQVLIRAVMNEIQDKSEWLARAESVTPEQVDYVRTLRGLLDRLTD
jgi:hypothetical protein